MSAFAGFVSFDPAGIPPGTEDRLRLGLDGEGLGPPSVRRFPQGVFVFRQRVVAPEDRHERQPTVGMGGRVLSVFDGRLDNRSELLEALGLHSPPKAPIPDGDLVRAAYERWEEAAAPRLLGDFAWAVWNGRDGRLMLARDHSPLRSLYFSRQNGFIAFATGYRPLLALPDVPRDADELSVADLLMTCSEEGERSFYKGISWVGSAERVVATAGGMRRDRLWEPQPRPTLRLARDGDYIDAARAVFEEAVACRLRVAGAVVSSVSGGLDSSAVAATAARRMAPGEVHGLCVVPVAGAVPPTLAGWYADERPFVAALAARHPNLRLECLDGVEAESIELNPASFFLRSCVPLRGVSNTAWFLRTHRRAAALGATSLLQGSMGNATFSADGLGRLSGLRQDGSWPALLRDLAALRRTLAPGAWRGLLRYQIREALPGWLWKRLRRLRHGDSPALSLPISLNRDFARAVGAEERQARHGIRALDLLSAGGRVAFLRFSFLRSRMQVDGRAAVRALTGITAADPFADRRVIDFCLSLPAEQFQQGGEWRRLARRAFADRLPVEILTNRRRGDQNSDWHYRLTPHRDVLAAELDRLERSALASRILDVPRLKRLMAGWPDDAAAVAGEDALYRTTLCRALHLGQYLCWIEGGNEGGRQA